MRTAIVAAALLTLVAAGPASSSNDLRDIRVGMAAADLPDAGYSDWSCSASPAVKIAGFQSWSRCPAATASRHAIRFRYQGGETEVAGHPVILTLDVDDKGTITELAIETDPAVPLFKRKKAFLLGLQARSHWGTDGWSCNQRPQGPDEAPVGGVYLDETCRKLVDGRRVEVMRKLFQPAGKTVRDFVGESRIVVTVSG